MKYLAMIARMWQNLLDSIVLQLKPLSRGYKQNNITSLFWFYIAPRLMMFTLMLFSHKRIVEKKIHYLQHKRNTSFSHETIIISVLCCILHVPASQR